MRKFPHRVKLHRSEHGDGNCFDNRSWNYSSFSEIRAVFMPCQSGLITTRLDIAGPHSLNEPRRPNRKGATPLKLCAELGTIINWLAVDNPMHKRYQPRSGLTFCNVYVHDYCYLSGVYLPRVWWTPSGIKALRSGERVLPCYEESIDEQRVNDLWYWLHDFGLRFGWQQSRTLNNLQKEVNQGAVGIIVARHKQHEFSGHVAVVVPETKNHRAHRICGGQIIAPLQSQAGTVNFRYGTGKLNWWKDEKFAESGFWFHK